MREEHERSRAEHVRRVGFPVLVVSVGLSGLVLWQAASCRSGDTLVIDLVGSGVERVNVGWEGLAQRSYSGWTQIREVDRSSPRQSEV